MMHQIQHPGRLDAKAKHSVMECVKAEAETSTLRVAVGNQARLMTNLITILARCTVTLSGSRMAMKPYSAPQ